MENITQKIWSVMKDLKKQKMKSGGSTVAFRSTKLRNDLKE